MENGKTSKFIVKSMPNTGWREPLRASDNMLKLPHGRPLKPTEELRERTLPDNLSGAEPSTSLAEDDVTGTDDDEELDALSERKREMLIVSLNGTSEQAGEYDGNVEDGPATSQPDAHARGSSASAGSVAQTSDVGAEGELDDDELLAGEERYTEDDDQNDASPPVVHSIHTCTHQAKTLREGTETIRPHPTDPSKAIVTYRYTDAAGNNYVQETELPEVVRVPANASGRPGSILWPDVERSKVPRTKKGSPWVPVPGTSRHEWTRSDGDQQETWRVAIFFRRLHRHTHAYQDIYVNNNMLSNVNPNDKRFRTSYNKWILQFARRRDATYTQKVARVHWSVPERCALYAGINTFCAKFGIHRFGFTEDCKLSTRQLQLMADGVNAAPNRLRVAPRGVDAVRGQIISAHNKARPKNKAIFDLLGRAKALRARVARGEVVPRAERKPHAAIALSEFPVKPPAATAGPLTPGGRKRKRAAVVEESDEEPSSSELSSPPGSEVGGNDGVKEVLSGEDEGKWVEVEVEVSSPPARKARTAWK